MYRIFNIVYYVFKKKSYCLNWFEDLLFLKIYMMAIAIPTRSAIAKTTITAIMVGVSLQFNKKIKYFLFDINSLILRSYTV